MLDVGRHKKGSGVVLSEIMTAKSINVIAGIDAGSTQTRVCIADTDDLKVFSGEDSASFEAALNLLQTQYEIPSAYAEVTDAREIVPVSSNLEDNFDSNVILLSNTAEHPLMSKHRVLRGRKTQDSMGLVLNYLDSSTNKSDNTIFYINIIDSLGYAILQKYDGALPREVNVYLVVSVRPKEMISICKRRMKENLVGSFIFNWKTMSITINIKGLDFTTEPEAQIMGTTTVYDLKSAVDPSATQYQVMADKLSDATRSAHIEGGGSSVGVEVMQNGSIIDACSAAFPLGGNYMTQLFVDRYREENGRTVTKEAASKALITCRLRDGRNNIDVTDLVAQVKSHVGMDIFERFRHEVIDLDSNLTLLDLEFITLGGRLFLPDASGNTIGDYFGNYVHQISPNTDIYMLSDNYIPQGNMVVGLNSSFSDYINGIAEPEEDLELEESEEGSNLIM